MRNKFVLLFLFLIHFTSYAQNSNNDQFIYEKNLEIQTSLLPSKKGNSYFGLETCHGFYGEINSFMKPFGGVVLGYLRRSLDLSVSSSGPLLMNPNDFNYLDDNLYVGFKGEVRFNTIRKLRKKIIPSLYLKFIHIFHTWENKKFITINSQPHRLSMEYHKDILEVGLGGEIVINNFPNLYFVWGRMIMPTLFSNRSPDGEYYLRTENPSSFNFKLGIRFR